jgi:phage protein D
MYIETIKIEIDGKEIADLYEDITSVEVELDDELPAMFRLRLPLALQENGAWTLLDDARLRVWNDVTILAGLDGDLEPLISGRITHVRPTFDPDPTLCVLDIWGLDRSVLLDREDKLKDWPNKKDSDIAVEIFDAYGLDYEVEDTDVIHDDVISTVIQRETDWQFLNRLARRNGFECFVEGRKGYFRRPSLTGRPQALLAVHFGDETNVNSFSLEVNALTPAHVAMYQVERSGKEIVQVSVESSHARTLGASGPPVKAGVNPGVIVLGQTTTTGVAEMTGVCRGLFEQQSWFVTGQGEIAANELGAVLRPRRTVTIKGIGETYSGVYLVSHVTHTFSEDGYVQSFDVKRNALMPDGSEQFSAGAGGLLGGLI